MTHRSGHLEVASARWTLANQVAGLPGSQHTFAALRLHLQAFPNVTLPALNVPSLRIYFNYHLPIAHTLCELFANNCAHVVIRDAAAKSRVSPLVLSRGSVVSGGWSDKESLLPWPKRSFSGYRLLQEYFSFPEKFFFVDINGLDRAWDSRLTNAAEIVVLFSRFERIERQTALEAAINSNDNGFELGCSPIVNLFHAIKRSRSSSITLDMSILLFLI